MPRVTTHCCPHCGAPLTLLATATDVTCQFCSHAIHIERGNARPAPNPTPNTLYLPSRPGGGLQVVLAVLILFPIVSALVVLGIVLLTRTSNTAAGRPPHPTAAEESALADRKPVSFPVHCGINETLEIVNTTFESTANGPLIRADVNCTLLIKNSRLKGETIVDAPNLLDITIDNSTLEGTAFAINARLNPKIHVSGQSVVKGLLAGISVETNARIVLTKSRVQGLVRAIVAKTNLDLQTSNSELTSDGVPLESGLNAHVVMLDSTLKGQAFALMAGHNLELELLRSTVRAEQVGLCAGVNASIHASNSTIDATAAMQTQGKPQRLNLVGTQVKGGQNFAAKHCEP